jgi:hypothetical protein
MLNKVSKNMARAVKALVVAAFSVAFIVSVERTQQAGTGPGSGRKHHEQKADAAAPTAPKANEKAYNSEKTPRSRPSPPLTIAVRWR